MFVKTEQSSLLPLSRARPLLSRIGIGVGEAVGGLQQGLNVPFSLNCVRFLILVLPFIAHQDFTDGYEGVKWALLFLTALVLSSMTLLSTIKTHPHAQEPWILPVLEKSTKAVFSAFVICLTLGYILHDVPFLSESFIGRVTGFILTGYFAHGFYHGTLSWHKLCPPVMGAGFIFLCHTGWTAAHTTHFNINTTLSGAFGNINMSAFFMGVVLICTLYYLAYKETKWHQSCFGLITLSGCCIYLYYAGCRSVFLGSILAVVSLIPLMRIKRIYGYVFTVLTITVLFINSTPSQSLSNNNHTSIDKSMTADKKTSAIHRWTLYQEAFDLIKDHPFGVGPDRFEFAIIPYKDQHTFLISPENELEKSPHNELLRWLAEEGWITTSLLLFLVGMVVFQKRSLLLNALKTSEGKFALSLSVLLVPEFLFQFPLQAAFPYLIVCLLGGYLLSVCFLQTNMTRMVQPSALILGLFTLTYGTLISLFLFAKAVESKQFYSPQNLERACALTPFNWRVCVLKGIHQLNTQQPFEAMLTFQRELDRRPTNFVAQKLLGLSLISLGMPETGCQSLRLYDQALNHKSQLHSYIMDTCSKFRTR